jgi:hypothetical protein
MRHRHARCCASYGLPSAEPSSQRTDGNQTGSPPRYYPRSCSWMDTGFATTPVGSKICQDNHQFRQVNRLPLAYKRRRQSPGCGGGQIAAHLHISAFTTMLALRLNQTSGTWRLLLLSRLACSSPLQALRCNTIQHPERTPAGRTAHNRN